MLYRIAADAVLVVHLAFVFFVAGGALLAVRWPRSAYLHLPCAAWGAVVTLAGWICPLTPLEIRLRRAAGEEGYAGGFIEHYLLPVIYPAGLTREMQIGLGVAVVGVNVLLYAWLLLRRRSGRP